MTEFSPDQNSGISFGGKFSSVPAAQKRSRGQDTDYLFEHTIGSIIRCSFKIYFHHFLTLLLIFALPILPVAMIQGRAQLSGNMPVLLTTVLLSPVVGFFAYGATTVAVSDVCLGNAPTFKRSYGRILGRVVLLLGITSLLQTLVLGIAFAPLIISLVALIQGIISPVQALVVGVPLSIPGLTLMVWLLLSASVVVLEGKSGVAALKRSKQLADGSHWRNAGILLLLSIIMAVIGAVVGFVLGVVISALVPDGMEDWFLLAVITVMQQGLAAPISLIALVLVYYDLRVRKEGYDAKALAEDLAR